MLNKQETCCLQVLKTSLCVFHMTRYFISLLKAKVLSFWHPHFVIYIFLKYCCLVTEWSLHSIFFLFTPSGNYGKTRQKQHLPTLFSWAVEMESGMGGPLCHSLSPLQASRVACTTLQHDKRSTHRCLLFYRKGLSWVKFTDEDKRGARGQLSLRCLPVLIVAGF